MLDTRGGEALWVVVMARPHGSAPQRHGDARANGGPSIPSRTQIGTRWMLEHAIEHALQLVPGDRLITVIAAEHRRHLGEPFAEPPGLLLEQPRYCGSAPALLLSLAHVLGRDVDATVILLPADHFPQPEEPFLRILARVGTAAARLPDRVLLLGAEPPGPEAHAERIVTPPVVEERPADGEPDGPLGRPTMEAMFRDGGPRNTDIVAARAAKLWELASRFLPDMVRRFAMLRTVIKLGLDDQAPKDHETLALADVYRDMGHADYTLDVLHRAQESVMALSPETAQWSDRIVPNASRGR